MSGLTLTSTVTQPGLPFGPCAVPLSAVITLGCVRAMSGWKLWAASSVSPGPPPPGGARALDRAA